MANKYCGVTGCGTRITEDKSWCQLHTTPSIMWADPSWMESAACAGRPLEWWEGSTEQHRRLALDVCGGCPVNLECAVATLTQEQSIAEHSIYGIRGGMSAIARIRIKRQRNKQRTQ